MKTSHYDYIKTCKSVTKEIFVVDSYANTPKKEKILLDMVRYLKFLKSDVCLVSHLPIPHQIAGYADYCIYDSNNILGKNNIEMFYQRGSLEVRWRPWEYYHGAACYTNLLNAMLLLTDKYEWVHFVESDINVHVIPTYHQLFREKQFISEVIGYPFYTEYQSGIVTNLFSIQPWISKYLPRIDTYEDYTKQCSKHVFEDWLLFLLKKIGNLNITLLKDTPALGNEELSEGDYAVVCARQNNELMSVFIINRIDKPLIVRWGTEINLWEDRIIKNQVSYQHNCEPLDILNIKYEDGSQFKTFNVKELSVNGRFKSDSKITCDNKITCPDWK